MHARIAVVVLGSVLCSSTLALAQVGGLTSASLPSRPGVSPAPSPAQVLSIPVPPNDVFLAGPRTYKPRRLPFFPFVGPSYPPFYGYGDEYDPDMTARDLERRGKRSTGYLYFDVQPASAEVYVDGAYIGSVADVRRQIPGHPLGAGTHRIELRSDGYDDVSFDAAIGVHETTTYRRTMARTGSADAPRASVSAVPRAAAPKTFYVIPGCYAGDRHPKQVQPAPRCDMGKVRVVPPVVSSASRVKPAG